MSKASELLEKIDAEIKERVEAEVATKKDEINAYAKAKYDAAVEEKIGEIAVSVEADYAKAKEYLLEVVNSEAPAIAAEPAVEVEASLPNAENSTEVV